MSTVDFLEHVEKTARRAMRAIEGTGPLDRLLDGLASAAGLSDQGTGQPLASDADIPPGTTDPSRLLTLQDIEIVTGMTFDHRYPFHDEGWIGVTFTHLAPYQQPYFELRAARPNREDIFDPDRRWDHLRQVVAPQIPVDGLTPGAFRSGIDSIYFRAADQILHTQADFGGDPATEEWCLELARRALKALDPPRRGKHVRSPIEDWPSASLAKTH